MNEECHWHLEPPGGGPPKTPFATGAKARWAAESIRRRGDRRGDRKPVRAYVCDGCGKHFLTSRPK